MTHTLFGQNQAGWRDMSDYVVHFAKDHAGRTAYDNMMGILSSGTIRAMNPFGIARTFAPDAASQKAACFSEIPLHQLDRLAEARSSYGIVFRKDFVIHRGGNPILYAYQNRPVSQAIRSLMAMGAGDARHPVWRLTPFVDAPGTYGVSPYFFEWEREWRIIGDFRFEPENVAFLIIPEDLHEAAKSFFETVRDDNTGPAYDCPFIDPYWSDLPADLPF